MPWRGPAGEARHTGVSIGVWEREGKALGVPRKDRSSNPNNNGALARREATGCPALGPSGPAGVRQWERQERPRVRSSTPHPQEHGHQPCGTERVLRKLPLCLHPLL